MVDAVAVEQGLKPCPFCGSPTVAVHPINEQYCVICDRCGANVACHFDAGAAEAIAAWNNRDIPRASTNARALLEIARPCFHYAPRGTGDGGMFEASEIGQQLMRAMEKIAAILATPSQAPTDASTDEVERTAETLRQLMKDASPLPWHESDGERAPTYYLEIHSAYDGDVDGDTGRHITVGGDTVAALLDNERDYADCALIIAAVNALPSLLTALLQRRAPASAGGVLMTHEQRIEDFVCHIMDATPLGEWIAVQFHSNGDWSVAAKPLESAPASAADQGVARAAIVEECARIAENLHYWQGSNDLISALDRKRFSEAIRALAAAPQPGAADELARETAEPEAPGAFLP